MSLTTTENVLSEDVSLGHVLYGLQSAFALFLVPVLVGLVINLAQRTPGALLNSHLKYQRHSTLGLIGLMTLGYLMADGWMSVLLYATALTWFCHRIIRGWLSLLDGQAI
ncbi:MAG: hypothetical protein ACRCT7_10015 [Shewanella sp.]|uniref:hypothetical protein n=1 Tax=Shewanella sp. SNU WT4 TaxID=2590015 RepID=UPI0011298FC4|nr:hypothetical protein [Shewanella sp. SNU WT4]QDF66330.1 hypothetical protein FJQ87_06140 [Shewanella sp. SNU WT4]